MNIFRIPANVNKKMQLFSELWLYTQSQHFQYSPVSTETTSLRVIDFIQHIISLSNSLNQEVKLLLPPSGETGERLENVALLF